MKRIAVLTFLFTLTALNFSMAQEVRVVTNYVVQTNIVVTGYIETTLAQPASAADSKPVKNDKPLRFAHGMGFAAGYVSGYGLSYRYWPGDWGIQITLSPVISSQSSLVSAGVNILKTMYEGRFTRLYLYGGVSAFYTRSDYLNDLSIHAGIGNGVEITLFNNIGINIQGGARYFINQNAGSYYGVNLSAEGGVFYRF